MGEGRSAGAIEPLLHQITVNKPAWGGVLFACQLGKEETQYQETAPDQLILGHYLNGGVFPGARLEMSDRADNHLCEREAVTIPLVFWDFVMFLLLFKLTTTKKNQLSCIKRS